MCWFPFNRAAGAFGDPAPRLDSTLPVADGHFLQRRAVCGARAASGSLSWRDGAHQHVISLSSPDLPSNRAMKAGAGGPSLPVDCGLTGVIAGIWGRWGWRRRRWCFLPAATVNFHSLSAFSSSSPPSPPFSTSPWVFKAQQHADLTGRRQDPGKSRQHPSRPLSVAFLVFALSLLCSACDRRVCVTSRCKTRCKSLNSHLWSNLTVIHRSGGDSVTSAAAFGPMYSTDNKIHCINQNIIYYYYFHFIYYSWCATLNMFYGISKQVKRSKGFTVLWEASGNIPLKIYQAAFLELAWLNQVGLFPVCSLKNSVSKHKPTGKVAGVWGRQPLCVL